MCLILMARRTTTPGTGAPAPTPRTRRGAAAAADPRSMTPAQLKKAADAAKNAVERMKQIEAVERARRMEETRKNDERKQAAEEARKQEVLATKQSVADAIRMLHFQSRLLEAKNADLVASMEPKAGKKTKKAQPPDFEQIVREDLEPLARILSTQEVYAITGGLPVIRAERRWFWLFRKKPVLEASSGLEREVAAFLHDSAIKLAAASRAADIPKQWLAKANAIFYAQVKYVYEEVLTQRKNELSVAFQADCARVMAEHPHAIDDAHVALLCTEFTKALEGEKTSGPSFYTSLPPVNPLKQLFDQRLGEAQKQLKAISAGSALGLAARGIEIKGVKKALEIPSMAQKAWSAAWGGVCAAAAYAWKPFSWVWEEFKIPIIFVAIGYFVFRVCIMSDLSPGATMEKDLKNLWKPVASVIEKIQGKDE